MTTPSARALDGIRSLLFVPVLSPKYIDNALRSDADAFILDLEDAIAPDARVQDLLNLEKLDQPRLDLDQGHVALLGNQVPNEAAMCFNLA